MAEEGVEQETAQVESPTTEPTEPVAPTEESSTETENPKTEEVVEEEKKPETRATKRIRKLVEERNELRKKLEERAPQTKEYSSKEYSSTVPQASQQTPEVRQAVDELRSLGFATKDDVQRIQDRMSLDSEYARLEKEYDGADGNPKFDRKVVEDYSISSGIYNPRAAYEDLYRDELRDSAVNQALSSKPKVPFTEKPTASGGKKPPLTRTDIAKMSTTEYQRRHSEIMEAMASGAL